MTYSGICYIIKTVKEDLTNTWASIEKENNMSEMDKKEIKEVIEWCDEKGHSEHEILELIRRIVDAKPREENE